MPLVGLPKITAETTMANIPATTIVAADETALEGNLEKKPVVLYIGTNSLANTSGEQQSHSAIPVWLTSKDRVNDTTLQVISNPPSSSRAISTRAQLVRLLHELKPAAVMITHSGEGKIWGHDFKDCDELARAILDASPSTPCLVQEIDRLYRKIEPKKPSQAPIIHWSDIPYGGVDSIIRESQRGKSPS
jgi:hypothetical protein